MEILSINILSIQFILKKDGVTDLSVQKKSLLNEILKLIYKFEIPNNINLIIIQL